MLTWLSTFVFRFDAAMSRLETTAPPGGASAERCSAQRLGTFTVPAVHW